jgi:hypothetical protein
MDIPTEKLMKGIVILLFLLLNKVKEDVQMNMDMKNHVLMDVLKVVHMGVQRTVL